MIRKERLYQILLPVWILAAVLCLNGCSKAPINDKLEGMWKLESFTTLDDGIGHRCERIYYSITRQVVEVAEKQGENGYGAFIGRLEYLDDDAVAMSEFKVRAATSDSKKDATDEQMKPFGMDNAGYTLFRIQKLTGKELVLESNYATLTFRKF